ncbi:MAG: SDR family oxidoreductase [Actinobacteria bacterium]|nr:MAG: SDR family oxidoreductase [Actinomycetota bacterium]
MARFEDKIAIVTGAARGIGEAYAKALAGEGARVVVADVDEEGAQKVAADIEGDGMIASAVRADVCDPASTEAMAGFAVERYGGIDHLVNNAAIYGGMKLDILLTVPWEYYKRFMSVNMDGALACVRACWPAMKERGGGSIVNQSSTASWMYAGYYGVAKVGINGLTQQLARELGGSAIRINAIAPGPIDTEATRDTVPPQIMDQIVSQLPLARMGTPEDLVGLCLFLLSDEASWITGQIFNVDGGQVFRS